MLAPPLAVFLMGPTASGKTAIAFELCDALPMDIVNVDAVQVYRGMNIGSAKPDEKTLKRYPHRLIDIRDPAQPYSAAEFCRDAMVAIREINANGRIPLLVGGTMFYFRALVDGLSQFPDADPEIRAEIEKQAARDGWNSMHNRLALADPVSAKRISMGDKQRLQRALEILYLTGVAPSKFANLMQRKKFALKLVKLALVCSDRSILHRRIENRFKKMLQSGLLDEVTGLKQTANLDYNIPAGRAVGYRQALDYLCGNCDFETMEANAAAATRQLAKRQLTWLRQYPGITWFDALSTETCHIMKHYLHNKLMTIGYNFEPIVDE